MSIKVRCAAPHCSHSLQCRRNVGKGPFAIMIQRGNEIVYINATSTRECAFRAGFAAECG